MGGLVINAHLEYTRTIDRIIQTADPNTPEGRAQLQAVNESLDRMIGDTKSQAIKQQDSNLAGDFVALKMAGILK